ncbi:MAG: cytochrome P450 [Ignavibacteriales bacterium]|nr:cytochrome P450 [Ignavibacteriales bacterium]
MKKLKQIKGLQLFSLLPRMLYNLPDTLAQLAQSGDGIMKIGFDKSNFIFISEPEYIKHILKTNVQNYSRGKSAMELKPILGNGIFISGENDWKRQRQALLTG